MNRAQHVVAGIAAIPVALLIAHAPPDPNGNHLSPPSGRQQTRHIQRLQAALAWQKHERRRLRRELRRRDQPTVTFALRLAATTFQIDYWSLRRRAYCESRLDPRARNGQYLGLLQEGDAFWRHSPFSSLGDRFNPILNAMAAAQVIASEGDSQWSCPG